MDTELENLASYASEQVAILLDEQPETLTANQLADVLDEVAQSLVMRARDLEFGCTIDAAGTPVEVAR